jgi:hypothetical protein
MDTLLVHTDQEIAVERIETAMRDHQHCSTCGTYMTVVERGSAIRVECATLATRHGLRYRLAAGLHDSLAIELPETVGAAA